MHVLCPWEDCSSLKKYVFVMWPALVNKTCGKWHISLPVALPPSFLSADKLLFISKQWLFCLRVPTWRRWWCEKEPLANPQLTLARAGSKPVLLPYVTGMWGCLFPDVPRLTTTPGIWQVFITCLVNEWAWAMNSPGASNCSAHTLHLPILSVVLG